MFTLIGIGMVAMAFVFLVLGLVALIRCDQAAIPDTVRALSAWLGHRNDLGPLSAEHAHGTPNAAEDQIHGVPVAPTTETPRISA